MEHNQELEIQGSRTRLYKSMENSFATCQFSLSKQSTFDSKSIIHYFK